MWTEYNNNTIAYEFELVSYGKEVTHVNLYDKMRKIYVTIKGKQLFWSLDLKKLVYMGSGHWEIVPGTATGTGMNI